MTWGVHWSMYQIARRFTTPWAIPERDRARLLRAESFNVFNHTNFTGINTTVRFDNSGNPTGGFGAVNASGPGRVLSLGLKLVF